MVGAADPCEIFIGSKTRSTGVPTPATARVFRTSQHGRLPNLGNWSLAQSRNFPRSCSRVAASRVCLLGWSGTGIRTNQRGSDQHPSNMSRPAGLPPMLGTSAQLYQGRSATPGRGVHRPRSSRMYILRLVPNSPGMRGYYASTRL